MSERAREARAAARGGRGDGEADVRAKIAEMGEPDRGMAERIHALVASAAPDLSARTWYGMPAYARDGEVVCFFQAAGRFKARYATIGFTDKARLDDGAMWATSFALTEWTADVERAVAALVRKAANRPG